MWSGLILLAAVQAGDPAGARACTPAEVRDLTAPSDQAYRLTCRADLAGVAVRRPVLMEGAEASGAGIDCGGGVIRPAREATSQTPTVAIWSRRQGDGWSRPVQTY
ncbi:MAG: right-handed parallel beta-helix repeat-containing protein, partial [Brevundimonas sp.]|nr:right-handed parallel beta-helix repeat-containing protein [Brevundimonas sp.]